VLCAYLSYAARPDNLIYAALFPAFGIVLLSPQKRKAAIYFLLGLAGFLAIDALLKFVVFGDPLPLPFYAKSNGYYDGYLGIDQWNTMEHLLTFVAMALPFLAILVFAVEQQTARICVVFLAPFVLTVGYYFRVVQIMGQEARYYYPSMPFLAICSFLTLGRSLNGRSRRSAPGERELVRIMAFGLLAALATSSFFRGLLIQYYADHFVPRPTTYATNRNYDTSADRPLPRLGWTRSIAAFTEAAVSLPPGTRVALSEYGYIGAKAPHVYILDPIGLHDPYFARHGFSAEAFFRRRPDLIWLPHPDYSRIISEILDAGEFQAYDYYPGAFDYGLAIRRDSGNYQVIYDVVASVWQQHYGDAEMSHYLARIAR
jgi:hypothetical protein